MLLASSAEVLWHGAKAAGVADAMIEAETAQRKSQQLCDRAEACAHFEGQGGDNSLVPRIISILSTNYSDGKMNHVVIVHREDLVSLMQNR